MNAPASREQCIRDLAAAYRDAWTELWESARVRGIPETAELCAFPGRNAGEIRARLEQFRDGARAGRAA